MILKENLQISELISCFKINHKTQILSLAKTKSAISFIIQLETRRDNF